MTQASVSVVFNNYSKTGVYSYLVPDSGRLPQIGDYVLIANTWADKGEDTFTCLLGRGLGIGKIIEVQPVASSLALKPYVCGIPRAFVEQRFNDLVRKQAQDKRGKEIKEVTEELMKRLQDVPSSEQPLECLVVTSEIGDLYRRLHRLQKE